MIASLLLSLFPADSFTPEVINLQVTAQKYPENYVGGDERYVVVATQDGPIDPLSFVVLDLIDKEVSFLPIPGGYRPVVANGLLAVQLPETVDENGDGDTDDDTVHIVDLESGEFWSTGLATGPGTLESHVVLGRGWVALAVHESDQGADLDGNGVLSGRVVHVFNIETESVLNYGVGALAFFGAQASVAFSVPESSVGHDLNSDGDVEDVVAHLLYPRSAVLHNTGLAGAVVNRSERVVTVGVAEAAQGGDLNGDGDALDSIVYTVDAKSLVARSTGLPVFVNADMNPMDGARMLLLGSEVSNEDLNGDGDALDFVWHAYDAQTQALVNLGLTSIPFFGVEPPIVSRSTAAFAQAEWNHGSDLDGDHELLSTVRLLYDFETGVVTNTQKPIAGWDSPQHPEVGTAASPWYVVDRVQEQKLGEDQNGDGDEEDVVLVLTDFRSKTVSSLGIASNNLPVTLPETLVSLVDEEAQGTDLDGNGVLDGRVIEISDPASGEVLNTGLHASLILEVGGGAIFVVSEQFDGTDYNNDGDLTDGVVFAVIP